MEIPSELLKKLKNARHVAALTGAGVSAESGIKTFRDPDGLWAKFNPQELASVDGFMANPELVWEWYQHRRSIVNSAEPNEGHYALAEMEKLFPEFTLITQNVDRLHQRAGSMRAFELHGNIIENHCQSCKEPFGGETALPKGELPRCTECGGMVRPSVVWFGEMLPYEALAGAEEAAIASDVFFTIGTSAEVYPAAFLPVQAGQSGAYVIEINPNETGFSRHADYCIRAPFAVAMPELLEKYKQYIKGDE